MDYKVIDREAYYRKGVFRHFSEDCKCSTSMTARIDVTDLVDAHVKALEKAALGKVGIYNVGTGKGELHSLKAKYLFNLFSIPMFIVFFLLVAYYHQVDLSKNLWRHVRRQLV